MSGVVDASVAVKWFLDEPESEAAIRVVGACLDGDPHFVPELFYYEVVAVLARRHPRFPAWCDEGMRWLTELPLRRFALTPEQTPRLAEFVRAGLTGYDAAYAALAADLDVPWLTFDRRAASALGHPDWIKVPG